MMATEGGELVVLILFLALFAYIVVFLTVELSPTEPNQRQAADEEATRASFSTPVRQHSECWMTLTL
jgi:hypothetical protein